MVVSDKFSVFLDGTQLGSMTFGSRLHITIHYAYSPLEPLVSSSSFPLAISSEYDEAIRAPN